MKRILAIGDIHGCDVAFSTLLDGISLTPDDTVIVLGDFIDRGPNSKAVIDRLIRLSQEVTLMCICGNHEEAFLTSLERGSPRMLWIGAGAIATLDSYGGSLSDIPQDHIDFFKSLRDYWQTDTHIFVHANVETNTPLEQQSSVWLRWDKFTGDEVRHCSGKIVICGHTGLPGGVPVFCDGFVCIDTKASAGLWLTCLDVENEIFWQAAQTGAFRGPLRLRQFTISSGRRNSWICRSESGAV